MQGKHRRPVKARTRGPATPNPKHRRDVEADTDSDAERGPIRAG